MLGCSVFDMESKLSSISLLGRTGMDQVLASIHYMQFQHSYLQSATRDGEEPPSRTLSLPRPSHYGGVVSGLRPLHLRCWSIRRGISDGDATTRELSQNRCWCRRFSHFSRHVGMGGTSGGTYGILIGGTHHVGMARHWLWRVVPTVRLRPRERCGQVAPRSLARRTTGLSRCRDAFIRSRRATGTNPGGGGEGGGPPCRGYSWTKRTVGRPVRFS